MLNVAGWLDVRMERPGLLLRCCITSRSNTHIATLREFYRNQLFLWRVIRSAVYSTGADVAYANDHNHNPMNAAHAQVSISGQIKFAPHCRYISSRLSYLLISNSLPKPFHIHHEVSCTSFGYRKSRCETHYCWDSFASILRSTLGLRTHLPPLVGLVPAVTTIVLILTATGFYIASLCSFYSKDSYSKMKH